MNAADLPSLPPNSPEDERGVIGCLSLEYGRCMPEYVADFQGSPDQFYDSRHRVVFEAIRELLDAKLPVDVLAVERRLKKAGRIEDAGGVPYLHSLPEASPSVWNLKAFAGEVELLPPPTRDSRRFRSCADRPRGNRRGNRKRCGTRTGRNRDGQCGDFRHGHQVGGPGHHRRMAGHPGRREARARRGWACSTFDCGT